MKMTEDEKCEKTTGTPPCPPQAEGGLSLAKGEGSSAGFWEYVIIAVVIAAAAALAFAIWGKSVVGEASVSAAACCGNTATATVGCQSAVQQGACRATESNKKFSDGEKCREKWGGVKASTVDPVPIPDDGGASPSDEFKKKILK